MNIKVRLVLTSTLILIIILFNAPLTFSQQIPWDYCKVYAYGTNVLEEVIGEIVRVTFNVVDPPAGTEISNTYEVMNYDSGENYTDSLSSGDEVRIRYDFITPINYTISPASESNHYMIYYEGEVYTLRINSIHIPEYPAFMVIPLFITATLLALIYRRKHKT